MQIIKYLILIGLIVLSILFIIFYFFIFPKIVYSFLKKIKNPTKKDKVLVFAPHPDDESLGCFGYLNRAVQAKSKIKIVILTDGHFFSQPEKRYRETLETLSEIGIAKKDVFFLGFKDIHLKKVKFCNEVMKDMINSFKPTIIFSTSNHDSNQDHKACYNHLKKALENIKFKINIYYYLIHYKEVVHPFPGGFKPNKNIYPPMNLINKKREWLKLEMTEKETILKNRAIMNYKSQLRKTLFLTRRKLLAFIRKNELFYREKENI